MKKWLITLCGSLFFFYSFFQVNMMTALSEFVQSSFHLTGKQLAVLSATCFYSNILFLLPAGLILDRFPIKKIFLSNMILVIAGTLIFAFSTNLSMAIIGRLITGIMISFGLITCMKLASLYLPVERMALASSLILTIGMFGGMASQTPLLYLAEHFGWRKAVLFSAFLGMVIFFILMLVIRSPKHAVSEKKESAGKNLLQAMKNQQNWFLGIFISLLNMPVAILGALFGITFLVEKGIVSLIAGSIVSMLFLGMIVGSPIFGWVSDRLRSKKIPLIFAAGLCFCIVLSVLLFSFSTLTYHVLFFLIGFFSSAQGLGYAHISETNPPEITGTALGLSAILIMGGGYGVGLPFMGWLIEKSGFFNAFWLLPATVLFSLLIIPFLREKPAEKTIKI